MRPWQVMIYPALLGLLVHLRRLGQWFLLLVVRPGDTSSVLAPSSDGLQPNSDGLHLVASLLLVETPWMSCETQLELSSAETFCQAFPGTVETDKEPRD